MLAGILVSAILEPVDRDLRLMSFNIRYGTADDGPNAWPHRREMVFALIHRENPDILGLQEALWFQVEEIRRAVPGYDRVTVGRDDGRLAGEHCTILFRVDRFDRGRTETFWFSDTPEAPGSRSWGNRVTRICTSLRLFDRRTRIALDVYNLHLDHESQPSRERSIALLGERMRARPAPMPTVVMGDFNAGEANPAVRAMEGLGFRNAFRVVHPDAREVGTFNGFRGRRDGDMIDFVFVSPEFRVLGADILRDATDGRTPSDHFPVTARVRLGPEGD